MISESLRASLSLADKRGRSPDSRMEATDQAARRIAAKEAPARAAKTASLAALRRERDAGL